MWYISGWVDDYMFYNVGKFWVVVICIVVFYDCVVFKSDFFVVDDFGWEIG